MALWVETKENFQSNGDPAAEGKGALLPSPLLFPFPAGELAFQCSRIYLDIMCCGGRWDRVLSSPLPSQTHLTARMPTHTWPVLLWAKTVLSHWHLFCVHF